MTKFIQNIKMLNDQSELVDTTITIENGKILNDTSLTDIRNRINSII